VTEDHSSPARPNFSQALRVLLSRPLAIAPEYLDPLMARMQAGDLDIEAAAARPSTVRTAGGIAVIPIIGPIQQRADMWSAYGFTVSVEDLQRALRAALADDSVGSIVFDIDSPGGDVSGIDEFAAEIFAARGRGKPMTAVANAWTASAAYYLASQADEIVVTPSGMVGSIGVITAHTDFSRMYDEAGITVTVLRTPAHKAEGGPYEPLSQDAQDYIQGQLDTYYGMFVAAVARGRGVSAATVRNDFGAGRMVMAEEAVKLGMADRVGTIDSVLGRGTQTGSSRSMRAEDEQPLITTEEPSERTTTQAPSTDALYALVRER
jgi:signal peptide peptidase SppA